jgi:hypothetical protein
VNRSFASLTMLLLSACAPDTMTVDSNVRMPGEPATVARRLTTDEQARAVDAMATGEPPGFEAQPLARAGAAGRWSDVREVVIAAVKSCEIAMVRQDRLTDASGAVIGATFVLRSISDQPGSMRVTGSDATGVTGVEVSMGNFGEQKELARCVLDAFDRELRTAARIPRPK